MSSYTNNCIIIYEIKQSQQAGMQIFSRDNIISRHTVDFPLVIYPLIALAVVLPNIDTNALCARTWRSDAIAWNRMPMYRWWPNAADIRSDYAIDIVCKLIQIQIFVISWVKSFVAWRNFRFMHLLVFCCCCFNSISLLLFFKTPNVLILIIDFFGEKNL